MLVNIGSGHGLAPSDNSAIASPVFANAGLILGLCPANDTRRYFVTTSLIGWAQV